MKIDSKLEKQIKKWAKATDRDVKDIKSEMADEMKEDYMKNIPKNVRVQTAWNTVKSKMARAMGVPTKPFLIHVIDKCDAKTIKTKKGEDLSIGNVFGLAQAIGDDDLGSDIYFMDAVAMREATSVIDDVEIGQAYEIQMKLDKVENNLLKMSFVDKKSKPTKADGLTDKKIKKIVDELFESVDIADAAFKLSEDANDLKMIRGNVMSSRVGTSQKGNPYGLFVLIDDSLDIKDIQETGGFTVFCDASQVRVADGSDIKVIGVIEENDKGTQMRATAIIPEVMIPREIVSVEDEDEMEDIEDEMEDDFDDDEDFDEDEDEDEDDDDEDFDDDDDDEDFDDTDEDEDDDDFDFDDDEEEEEIEEKPKKKPSSKKKSTSKKKPKKKKIPEDEDE